MNCKGFLFDLDGTLVDSLPAVERAWTDWAVRFNIPPRDVLSFIHGKQALTSLRHFMSGYTEAALMEELHSLEKRESEDTADVVALPGAIALLTCLNDAEIPWAIVTSGTVPVATARYTAAGLPEPRILVTAENVARGKPEPDAYLLGAQLLALEPQECVVVEDAPAGILSGLAAGCHVIAVNPPDEAPRLRYVDHVIQSLSELLVQKREDRCVEVFRKQ